MRYRVEQRRVTAESYLNQLIGVANYGSRNMRIYVAIAMLIAIIWLAYSNHIANTNALDAAKIAQEHIPFKPFDPAQKRTLLKPSRTAQSDFPNEAEIPDQETNQFRASTASAGEFKCDGRTHCSHMRSCAEATFFIQHCPNTSMDGDNDGIPCERQWC